MNTMKNTIIGAKVNAPNGRQLRRRAKKNKTEAKVYGKAFSNKKFIWEQSSR